VRIFEEIFGVFQDAHFSKPVRIFEWAAHLRSRASALGYPLAGAVPFARKVVQTLVSASIVLCCVETKLVDKPAEPACNCARRIVRRRVQGYALAKQKEPCLDFDPGTAPCMRDLQLVAVPCFVVRSWIIPDEVRAVQYQKSIRTLSWCESLSSRTNEK
jgi:hypothetical protein